MVKNSYFICKYDVDFICIIVVLSCLLYSNTIPSGYVWDDRAAIIGNDDVHGTNSIKNLFLHDFWGQNMSLADSHKSYRPLTVLTYRFNHYIHGLSAMGYHIGNVVVYILGCSMFYILSLKWLNVQSAQLATLLFTVHPIHVESVASIVGRADALCGLFYCLSVWLYMNSCEKCHMPEKAGCTRKYLGLTSSQILYYCGSLIVALVACLSKEIGITLFGVFMVLEVMSHFNEDVCPSKGNNATTATSYPFQVFFKSLATCFTTPSSVLKMGCSIVFVSLFMVKRLQLHGTHENLLYKWTILENHIHLLPSLHDRILSYAQTHFWYIFKLIYPRYLCFDYGFVCIPTIHSLFDIRNILPLITYMGVLGLSTYSLHCIRRAYIAGLAFLLLPLFPALNILFPVGTLLAERLLYIPSMGFCIIVGEFLTVDCIELWNYLGIACWEYWNFSYNAILGNKSSNMTCTNVNKNKHATEQNSKKHNKNIDNHQQVKGMSDKHIKKNKNKAFGSGRQDSITVHPVPSVPSRRDDAGLLFLLYVIILPIIILFSIRVYTRNIDWQSERQIYRSALDVCPNSVKALNNDAVMSFSRNEYQDALEKIERSIALYPGHSHAYLNAGVACSRLGDPVKALYYYTRGVHVAEVTNAHKQGNGKNFGYKGMLLYEISNMQPYPPMLELKQILGWSDIADEQLQGEVARDMIEKIRIRIRNAAEIAMETALDRGFDMPSLLHSRASLAIDKQQYELAIAYLQAAISYSIEIKSNKDLPQQDLVNEALSYNQLAIAYDRLGNRDSAIAAYENGLKYEPSNCDLLTNLGNQYKVVERYDDSRRAFQKCLHSRLLNENDSSYPLKYTQQGPPPAALLNNYGLLLQDVYHNYSEAITLFKEAIRILEANGGGYGLEIMRNNYAIALDKLRNQNIMEKK